MMYDEEILIDDIVSVVKAKLNEEILKINNEKGATLGDELFLNDIPQDSFVFEVVDKNLLNLKDFFVLYGLIDAELSQQTNANSDEKIGLTFQVATFDKGEKSRNNMFKKLLRYRRALKSVFVNNPDMCRGYAKLIMASLKPDAFPYDNNKLIFTIGIDVNASITSN